MPAHAPTFEYQSATCDAWQVAHLCNHMADHGWEPVALADAHHERAKAYSNIGDENGAMYSAVKLILVLFRRPSDYNADEDD